MFYVYALTDPFDYQIRYVGQTGLSPNERLNNHIKDAAQKSNGLSRKEIWIKRLLSLGAKPGIVVLQICKSREDALAAEERWITEGKALLWEIENVTHATDRDDVYDKKMKVTVYTGANGRPSIPFDDEFVDFVRKTIATDEAIPSVNMIRRLHQNMYGKECRHQRAKALFNRLVNEF